MERPEGLDLDGETLGPAGASTDGLGVPGQAARVDDQGTHSGAPRE
jgi:hypothetical protein